MATKRRVRSARGSYQVGYGRPPVASRFQKGQSGNPGGRPRAVAPDKSPKLQNPILDATFRVMGEPVFYEVAPGCRQWITRAEALVRENCVGAAYDPRAFKLLIELAGNATWKVLEAKQALERVEERRLQLLREEEKVRQHLADLVEERRQEAKLEKNRKRRERRALKKPQALVLAQTQAQAHAGVGGACEVEPAAAEAGLEARAEEPLRECGDEILDADQPDDGGWEDERLGDRGPSPAVAIQGTVPERRDEAPAQLSWPDVCRLAVDIERGEPRKGRRRGEPLIANTRPLTGSGYF